MKTLVFLVVCVSVLLCSCSQESRNEAIERASNAASALNGGDKSAEKEHGTPLIVQEQKKKENIRQNTEWTAENQALYPIEYCQAKLKDLDTYAERLEVSAHAIAVELNKVKRNMGNDAAQLKQLQAFLSTAKKAYLEAEASGKWPVNINGFAFSQDNAKLKIIEAARKVKELEGGVNTPKNQQALL